MKEVYKDLKKELLSSSNQYIVVAVSGGVDSMSLLDLLVKLKDEIKLKIVCCHVNHNVREESAEEKIFVEEYCKRNGVIFEYMKIESYGNDNFHNEARNIRYNFFEDMVNKYKSKYLLTAHHADDLIETILMRIVRGTTFKGYGGFGKKTYKKDYILYRPLINVNKDNIYDYAAKNEIEYVQDNSNFKDVYTRNRFRKYIIPLLKKEDNNIYSKFYKFSTLLLENEEFIEKQVEKVKNKVIENNIIKIDEFLKLEHVICKRLIYLLLEKVYINNVSLLTDKHVNSIYNLIISNKPNGNISLPNKIKGIKSYNSFELVEKEIKLNDYKYEINNLVNLPNGRKIEVISSSNIDDNNICRLSFNSVTLPLFVRNKKNGDKIIIKGMNESKKVSEVFINSKLDLSSRRTWPIVVDSNDNIVWIPGLKKSKFNSSKDEKCDIILRYY
ncbi:MAG: tRNA lysidine(34) synthetase TilS [Clostridium sp.]|nr:tRNA lysidine(34) synthetase TilS [Clostridium sp.]MCM1443793.1 tRNA lysidine(34) synthetase TilS [Candidatus Amulumruptor caecigallinarius]